MKQCLFLNGVCLVLDTSGRPCLLTLSWPGGGAVFHTASVHDARTAFLIAEERIQTAATPGEAATSAFQIATVFGQHLTHART